MNNISENILSIFLFLKNCLTRCVNKYLKKEERSLFIYRVIKYMDIAGTNYKLHSKIFLFETYIPQRSVVV